MNFVRNLFSSLISFFLVPLLVVYLIATSFFGVLIDQNTVKTILTKNDTYSRLSTKIIPQQLLNAASQYSLNTPIPPKVTSELLTKIDSKALSSDLEKLVNATYDFVTSNKEHFEIRLDLKKYSKSFADNLKPVLENYYNSLPVCSQSQTLQLTQKETSLDNLTCRIAQVDAKKYLENLKIDNFLTDIKTGFPEELVISDKEVSTYPKTTLLDNNDSLTKESTQNNSVLFGLQQTIQTYRSYLQGLLGSILILIIFLIATRLPKISSSCKWLSSAFFSASLLPLVSSSAILYFLKPEIFTKIISNTLEKATSSKLPTELVSLLSDNLFSISQKVFQRMQMLSFILIVIAIALYAFYLFLEQRSKQKARKALDEVIPTTHNVGS